MKIPCGFTVRRAATAAAGLGSHVCAIIVMCSHYNYSHICSKLFCSIFTLALMCCAHVWTICLAIQMHIHAIWFCHTIFHGGVCCHSFSFVFKVHSPKFVGMRSSEFHTASQVPWDFLYFYPSRMEFICSCQIFTAQSSSFIRTNRTRTLPHLDCA